VEPVLLVLCVVLLSVFGTFLGVLTGLTPGIHVNLVAASFVAAHTQLIVFVSFIVGWAEPTHADILVLICCVIVANAVSHTFLDYIPSVFLGAPDADTALSVLPGHRMLMKGRGFEAVLLSAFGSLIALVVFVCLLLPARYVMGSPLHVYDRLSWSIPLILMAVVAMLIVSERTKLERCKKVIRCTSDGILANRHEFKRMEALVCSGTGSSVSGSFFEAVVIEGSILRVSARSSVLSTGWGPVVVEFETPANLNEGDRVYIAGIVEPSHSHLQALVTKGWAFGVFLMSGLLGYAVLSTGLFGHNWYPLPSLVTSESSAGLFPLFTGLFGFSTLILSLARNDGIPEQGVDVNESELFKGRFSSGIKGAVAGCFAGWFPGVSNATATVIAKMLDSREKRDDSEREFIVAVSAVNTSSCFFTLLAIFVLLRARSGVMNAVMSELGDTLLPWSEIGLIPLTMTTLLLSGVIAACVGFALTRRIGRRFALMSSGLNYQRLVRAIILILLGMVILLSGIAGLVVALLATVVGMIPPLAGIKRVHLMGSLILPLMIMFAG
jgi:TctA family transporter